MREESDHSGHRQRLLAKLKKEDLTEHEILEILLFYVFKRRNTNDLAHRLLSEFGGLRNLLKTSPEQLQKVEGVGKSAAEFLYTLGRCNGSFHHKSVPGLTLKDGYDVESFVQYIRKEYEGLQTEVLDFYLLNGKGEVIRRRRFVGEAHEVTLPAGAFAQMILDNEPSGLIAVHNHPHGKAEPSEADDSMTRVCQIVCSFHDVLFCDHVILTKKGLYSYYREGEMQRISYAYNIHHVQKALEPQYSYVDETWAKTPGVFLKNVEAVSIQRRDGKFVGVIEEE